MSATRYGITMLSSATTLDRVRAWARPIQYPLVFLALVLALLAVVAAGAGGWVAGTRIKSPAQVAADF